MKTPEAFRGISEVAAILDVPQHRLRAWEARFPFVKPVKRPDGRRYYRPSDVAMLTELKRLLAEGKWSNQDIVTMHRAGALTVAFGQTGKASGCLPAHLAALTVVRNRLITLGVITASGPHPPAPPRHGRSLPGG